MKHTSRRDFLGGIGITLGCTAVGVALVDRLGLAEAAASFARERLRFGALDPLVDLMQSTPPDELMPAVIARLRSGTSLADIVGAGALANARAFGGTNYNGYHALMAMMPSYEMSEQMPAPYTPLPVLKVLHRNARFVRDVDRANSDAMDPLESKGDASSGANLVENIRVRDLPKAEQSLAAAELRSPTEAYEELQTVVRDETDVHRVVLSWRAYDLLRLTGQQNATTMLRQSVRFCIDVDGQRAARGDAPNGIRALLPKLMADHRLSERSRGTRAADDAWIEKASQTFFSASRSDAAEFAAAALADGIDPEDVGRALSLAAAQLLLHDPGLAKEAPGKPVGSVHGASIGVHASDAANAWRHIARVGSAPTAFASLITAAYHTAGQGEHLGAQPIDHDGEACTLKDPAAILIELDARIRARDQKGACIVARRYCELGYPSADLFARLLGFAVSEDGALHSEKFFRTAQEEHTAARAPHRSIYLAALSRVMASQFGFPAPGCEAARKLLAT